MKTFVIKISYVLDKIISEKKIKVKMQIISL